MTSTPDTAATISLGGTLPAIPPPPLVRRWRQRLAGPAALVWAEVDAALGVLDSFRRPAPRRVDLEIGDHLRRDVGLDR